MCICYVKMLYGIILTPVTKTPPPASCVLLRVQPLRSPASRQEIGQSMYNTSNRPSKFNEKIKIKTPSVPYSYAV